MNLHDLPITNIDHAALEKMGAQLEDFRLYYWGWCELQPPFRNFKVTGARFRRPKRGPRKDQLCIIVPGTSRSVYFTAAEVKAIG